MLLAEGQVRFRAGLFLRDRRPPHPSAWSASRERLSVAHSATLPHSRADCVMSLSLRSCEGKAP
eukprot:5643998-Alexandrium_andersonii.AAC.1